MRMGSIKLLLAAVALAPIAGVWSRETSHTQGTSSHERQLRPNQKERKVQQAAQMGVRSSHGSGYYGSSTGGGNGHEVPEYTERSSKTSKGGSGRHSQSSGGGSGGGRNQYYGQPSGGGYGGHYYGSGGGGGGYENPDESYYGSGSSGGGGHSGHYYGSGGSGGGGHQSSGKTYYGSGGSSGGGGSTEEYYGSGGGSGGQKPYPYSDDNYYDDYFMWEDNPQKPNDPYSDDNYYDDYFMWGDDKWNDKPNPSHDDYVQYPKWDDYTPGQDDFFVKGDDNFYPPSDGGGGSDTNRNGGGKSGKRGKSSKYCKKATKGSKGGKGSKGDQHYYECQDDNNLPGYDDWWISSDDDLKLDDTYFFLPRPVATIWGEAFSPQTTIPPVTPDPLVPDTADLGTTYLFYNWTTNVQDISLFEIPVFVDGEEVIIWISLDGYCTRFGTPDNSAQGYCHFTYTVYDPEIILISGSFVAEGFLVDATRQGEFTITGGTGILTGASGIVEVSPAILDSAMSPPLVVSPPEGADIFDGLAGYLHYFEVEADLFFFIPDLYYTGNAGKNRG